MLGFSMEVMDMVLAMLVLVMPELDTVILPMDTMVRDLLMLSQRLRLMQDFFMEDTGLVSDMLAMAMDLALDTVLDMVLDTVDTTMDKPLAKCLSKSSKATLCNSVPTLAGIAVINSS